MHSGGRLVSTTIHKFADPQELKDGQSQSSSCCGPWTFPHSGLKRDLKTKKKSYLSAVSWSSNPSKIDCTTLPGLLMTQARESRRICPQNHWVFLKTRNAGFEEVWIKLEFSIHRLPSFLPCSEVERLCVCVCVGVSLSLSLCWKSVERAR